jgi:hypothetical protein
MRSPNRIFYNTRHREADGRMIPQSRLRSGGGEAFSGMIRHILPVGAALLLASCSSLPVPGSTATAAPCETARQIIKQSAAIHGDAWGKYREVEVEYTGEWSAIDKRLQPVLTDSGFRGSSVEIYQPASGKVRQLHTGPLGTKTVDRRRPEIHVSFNGTASADREILDSAALVADAYTAFLFGPSWLSRKGTDFQLIGERTLDGESCNLIEGRLSPGFGNSHEDHFIAWIGSDTSLMKRLQFTLNGLDSTRGADVDVTFSEFHKTADGSVWPRTFVEYIQRPLRAKAHEWHMNSLKLDGSHAIKPGNIR